MCHTILESCCHITLSQHSCSHSFSHSFRVVWLTWIHPMVTFTLSDKRRKRQECMSQLCYVKLCSLSANSTQSSSGNCSSCAIDAEDNDAWNFDEVLPCNFVPIKTIAYSGKETRFWFNAILRHHKFSKYSERHDRAAVYRDAIACNDAHLKYILLRNNYVDNSD